MVMARLRLFFFFLIKNIFFKESVHHNLLLEPRLVTSLYVVRRGGDLRCEKLSPFLRFSAVFVLRGVNKPCSSLRLCAFSSERGCSVNPESADAARSCAPDREFPKVSEQNQHSYLKRCESRPLSLLAAASPLEETGLRHRSVSSLDMSQSSN